MGAAHAAGADHDATDLGAVDQRLRLRSLAEEGPGLGVDQLERSRVVRQRGGQVRHRDLRRHREGDVEDVADRHLAALRREHETDPAGAGARRRLGVDDAVVRCVRSGVPRRVERRLHFRRGDAVLVDGLLRQRRRLERRLVLGLLALRLLRRRPPSDGRLGSPDDGASSKPRFALLLLLLFLSFGLDRGRLAALLARYLLELLAQSLLGRRRVVLPLLAGVERTARLGLDARAAAAEAEVGLGADPDRQQVGGGDVGAPDDVRREREHDVGALHLVRLAAEQPAEDRDVGEPRDAGVALDLVGADQAGEEVGLAVLEPDGGLDVAGADDRLLADVARDVRDLDLDLERHLVVVVDARLDVDA